MKKTLGFVLALLLAVAFSACGDAKETKKETKKCIPAPGEICPVV